MKLRSVVRAYEPGKSGGSVVVTIPKEVREELGIQGGMPLAVRVDEQGRVIYERIR